MHNGSIVLSYALATLAGVCFITGITLLSHEGSVIEHGTREENISND